MRLLVTLFTKTASDTSPVKRLLDNQSRRDLAGFGGMPLAITGGFLRSFCASRRKCWLNEESVPFFEDFEPMAVFDERVFDNFLAGKEVQFLELQGFPYHFRAVEQNSSWNDDFSGLKVADVLAKEGAVGQNGNALVAKASAHPHSPTAATTESGNAFDFV